MIAHRLSTVLHADKIIVMNHGRIEAIGRHAELLASNETYSRFYRYQFAEAEPPLGDAISRGGRYLIPPSGITFRF